MYLAMFILVHSRSNIYLYTSSYLIIKSCACTLFDSWPEKRRTYRYSHLYLRQEITRVESAVRFLVLPQAIQG